ncbi:MAG: tetratricopeptide repeat protein, partial [Scytonema sp. PMC 1069.18]|nr:tetratricopeptide repeat protein [Scytonema sp. PMC 1069.18]
EASPIDWAATQNNLANAYYSRIHGDRAENVENAIAAYTAALSVRTREALPIGWAAKQYNLATAYYSRIRGDRAENIENAIASFVAALNVYTREALPQNWAGTQNNLANAYRDRIKGDKAENIENSIASLVAALEVYTRIAFPQEWAGIQLNLGSAYRNRIKEDKAQNLEQAIAFYIAALEVYTPKTFPQEWATTQNNLGNVYSLRIMGDKAQNLEQAIAAYTAVLEVHTRTAFPQEWARMQNNLGNAYALRIKGNKAENLEKAIAAYTQALEIYTRTAIPQEWARIKLNLGSAYLYRIEGDKTENLEKAIAAYTQALEIYTCTAFPQDWAMTQNNLGAAYSDRIEGDKAENLEKAIAAHTAALTVYTKEALPVDWAATQNNLAVAYLDRIKEDRADNIEMASAAFTAALSVRTREALPQDHAETLFSLGITYQNANQFDLAYNNFKSVIITIEYLRSEIVSGEESKRKQAEQFNKVYSRMVKVCLQLNKTTEAIEYAERSKTRNLVEQILERDAKTIFPPEVVIQLEKYRDEIAIGQYRIQNGKTENTQELAQHLNQLRQQRNELQNQYLSVGFDFKLDSFQTTLDEGTTIIEWYILDDKILAFIVKPTGDITVWQSQPEDREALKNWLDRYLQDYNNQKDEWKHSLGEKLKTLASILHIDEILPLIPKDCDRLILIPHRFLHLLPLHALPVGKNHQDSHYLLDLFTGGISYAPSCQLLQQVQKRERPNFESVFAIKNPTNDLAYTKLEVDSILNLFSYHQVLSDKQASKDALLQEMPKLKEANFIHFSCHGSFNLNSPQDSCLLLAESKDENNDFDLSKCLTLGNLFEQDFQLNNCRLVVLSACETGLVDFTNASDEYISLPSGFLYAGSTSVVCSLWKVNDLSTAFLMIKFLQNLQTAMMNDEDSSVAVNLSQAQKWLRNLTKIQLEEWIREHKLNLNATLEMQLRRWFNNIPYDSQLFQSPFYWAAFCGVGI